jgi:hypothetical protein
MKTKKSFLFILYLLVNFWFGCSPTPDLENAKMISKEVNITPDYSGITIPPNIAPLNFEIKESGTQYYVEIIGPEASSICIQSKSPVIRIPFKKWKQFLQANKGSSYQIKIALKDSVGNWILFPDITNKISTDSIDSYLAYRRLGPLYSLWKKMGIYQRCLENFDESPIMVNRLTEDNCMNCHNFCNSESDRWLIHLRGGPGTAMLLINGDEVRKIDTKTAFNGPVAYPAWHPSGNLAVFSANRLLLFFHSIGETRDVLDRYSDLVVYNITTNILTTTSQIASPEYMENWPAWSPDGRYLYFSRVLKLEAFEGASQQDLAYRQIKYDLVRVSYDEKTGDWGELELVLSGSKMGGSINQCRISPDGDFALFTISDYSNFPIYLSSADLYLMRLSTGQVKKLGVNSKSVESFHTWSSEGRWIVFSSKVNNNLFARPYFAYVDENGNASKPFILPQENPKHYETCLQTFNVPEFIRDPVQISAKHLAKAAYQEAKPVELDPEWIPEEEIEKEPISNPQPQ